MTEGCTHNCSTCSQNCADRKEAPVDLIEKTNNLSNVKKVIAVVSGKGGVGKSSVTSMLAVAAAKKGLKTAVLDADITGPSIPKTFGITQKAMGSDQGIFPAMTENNIEVISVNMLLENDTDPVLWRGPVIAGVVKQFWTDTIWGDVDVMFIDMPPGTGDVPLTVFQSIPVDGIVVVTTPQELVSMIVEKAVKMANKMDVPVLGIVENMSYFECPSCKDKHYIFGESHIMETAGKYAIPYVVQLPIDPQTATLCDQGKIEDYDGKDFDKFLDGLKLG